MSGTSEPKDITMQRRDLLKSGLALTSLAAAGQSGPVGAQPAGTANAAKVRKNVSQLLPNSPDLNLYRRAVQLLKGLNATDPRNWTRLAEVHQTYCPHRNWWFLPWHRAYLWYFEQTCRDVLQNPDFCLPYWDWTRAQRIPAPFWEGSLHNATRQITPNDPISSEFVGPAVITRIMDASANITLYSGSTTSDDQRETSAQGTLEATPHNMVHGTIRGDMGSYMSPLDPIFWLHHANVDRIWASWARDASNRFPAEPLWGNHLLASFFDPVQKKQVSPKTLDTLDAAKWGAEYDRYESSSIKPAQNLPAAAFVFGAASNNVLAASKVGRSFFSTDAVAISKPLALNKSLRLAVPVNAELTQVLESLSTPPPVDRAAPEATLVLEGVPAPKVKSSVLRVFLNCKNPSVNTPIDDASYVGTVGFFSHGGPGHAAHNRSDFALDIGPTLQKLTAAGQYNPAVPVDVALVAVDAQAPGKRSTGEVLKPERVRIVGVN
jgi:tyrosinase